MSLFDETIPSSIRLLIDAHIKSVVALEVLLLLYDQPQREWSVDEVAAKLCIDADWTVAQLKDLHAGGFIYESGRVYRYYPATLDLNAAIAALARLYRECPLSTISAIYQKPSVADHLANAFRLRG